MTRQQQQQQQPEPPLQKLRGFLNYSKGLRVRLLENLQEKERTLAGFTLEQRAGILVRLARLEGEIEVYDTVIDLIDMCQEQTPPAEVAPVSPQRAVNPGPSGDWCLFLDDERECNLELPPKNADAPWITARSSAEAINMVRTWGPPVRMSLDHDLGGDDTAMIFLRWYENELIDGRIHNLPVWDVHSANPVGRDNLVAFLQGLEIFINDGSRSCG